MSFNDWRSAHLLAVWSVFDRWFDSYRWWWCALSGLLLVASFAPFSCATCGWIALVPAWWVITRSEHARRQPMRHGYLIGLDLFRRHVLVDQQRHGDRHVLSRALPGALSGDLVSARGAAGRATAGRDVGSSFLSQALAAAALWVMLEWWRSWFLTGFNWNELGISQAPSIVFRQLAAFGGVHLISFVLVTVNILWAEGMLGIVEDAAGKAGRPRLVAVCARRFSSWRSVSRSAGIICSGIAAKRCGPALTFACIQPEHSADPLRRQQALHRFSKRRRSPRSNKTEKLSLEAITRRPSPISSSGPRR